METRKSLAARFQNKDGQLVVYNAGTVKFVPGSDEETSGCCARKAHSGIFYGENIIGASISKHEDINILHCPMQKRKDGKIVRKLKQVGPFQMGDPSKALETAYEIRRLNCHGDLQIMDGGILALVNPKSGKHRGKEVWAEAHALLSSAGIQCETIVTTHSGHGMEVVATSDLDKFGCIVVVGGDGAVHEVVQGLRRHLQAPKSLAMPICHIPAGSGNGMAASCGLWNPDTAVHALIKGTVRHVDAASVVLGSETVPRLAMLGVQYGLLSNLDIGTENLRTVLGGERFTYGAVKEIAKWNKHAAHIAYYCAPTEVVDTASGLPGELACPLLESVQGGKADFSDVNAWPKGWTVEKRESIRYMNLAGPDWAALDAKINPWGKLDDGLWEFATDKCQTRLDALRMLLETKSGDHENSRLFDYKRVSAFVIEPIGNSTYLTIDGELVALERAAVEVHRGLLTFVCAPVRENAFSDIP